MFISKLKSAVINYVLIAEYIILDTNESINAIASCAEEAIYLNISSLFNHDHW